MSMSDHRVDDLFADMRSIEATPSDPLTARLMADARREAETLAMGRDTQTQRSSAISLRLLVEQLIELIGGWRPALGMAASLCCGIWLGAVGPDVAVLLPGTDQAALTFHLPEDPLALIATP